MMLLSPHYTLHPTDALEEMLNSETGRRLIALSEDVGLDGELVNDAYKPRMHKLYASFMPAVQARPGAGRVHAR